MSVLCWNPSAFRSSFRLLFVSEDPLLSNPYIIMDTVEKPSEIQLVEHPCKQIARIIPVRIFKLTVGVWWRS